MEIATTTSTTKYQRRPSLSLSVSLEPVRPKGFIPAALYHFTSNNETDCRGITVSILISPCATSIHSGEVSTCNPSLLFSSAYCSVVGCCGEPIAFHTV